MAAVDHIQNRDYIVHLALRKSCIRHLAVRAEIGADAVAANHTGKSFRLKAAAPATSQGCECDALITTTTTTTTASTTTSNSSSSSSSTVSITVTHILADTSVAVTEVNMQLMRKVTSPSPAAHTLSQCATVIITIATTTCAHVQQGRSSRRSSLQSRLQQQSRLRAGQNKPERTSEVAIRQHKHTTAAALWQHGGGEANMLPVPRIAFVSVSDRKTLMFNSISNITLRITHRH
jgi:transglutaminase/protease-like cytokinesis protein 3